jgi:prepilin-type N-terminal cleavage/methylation domain-containing protein
MDRLIRPLLRVNAQRRSEGFTLIEVVVAMGILATGLLAVSAAQLYAMRGGRQGRHTTDAAEIAQSQIENFQRMDFDDAALDPTGGFTAPLDVPISVETASGVPVVEQNYVLTFRITDGPLGSGGVFLKTIDVRVDWDEPNRPGRSYTITTMRHKDAPSVN